MDVGSSINIYANLFGWHIFDLIYDFMVGTGIILIPFMILLYNAFMARDEGNRYDPVSALISIELRAYIAVALLIIFMVPKVSANKLLFVYDDGAKIQKTGTTGTTFDRYAGDIPSEVKIPFGWYAVLYASSGFTKTIKSMLPTGLQARQVMYQLQQANMDDPKLQAELDKFEKQCARPARARLTEIMRHPDYKLAQKFDSIIKDVQKNVKDQWKLSAAIKGTDSWKIAAIYPGNELFMDYLYDDELLCKIDLLNPANSENPKTSVCIPQTSAALTPAKGGDCKKMWKGGWGGFGNGLVDRLQKYYKDSNFNIQNEDSFIYGRLTSGTLHMNEKGIGNINGSFWQWTSEKIGAIFLNIGNLFSDMFNSIIRFLLPIALGITTLLFIVLMPILIIFGQYSIGNIMKLGVTYFGLAFLPGIWHIAAWVDQVMLVAVYGAQGIIEGAGSMRAAVIGLVSLGVYTTFTWLWLGFLRELGGYATHVLSATTSRTTGEASSSHASGANHGMRGGRSASLHGRSAWRNAKSESK